MNAVVEYLIHPHLWTARRKQRLKTSQGDVVQSQLGSLIESTSSRTQMVEQALAAGLPLQPLEDHFDWLDAQN